MVYTSNRRPARIPREGLVRFFIAMGRQILEIGDPNFPGKQPELFYVRMVIPIPEQFVSHEHALLHMEIILAEVIEYSEAADKVASQGPVSEDVVLSLMADFHAIKMHLEKWKAIFELFSTSDSNEFSRETPESLSSSSVSSSPSGGNPRPARSPAFLILKVYHAIMTAFITRIERNDETAFHDFMPDFRTALEAAEEFIQLTSTYVKPLDKKSPSRSPSHPAASSSSNPFTPEPRPPVIRSTFSLALGIVPNLFLIASRASDLALRDKALHLLRTCNRREGLWDSRLAARLVDRIIELRESVGQTSTNEQPLNVHRGLNTYSSLGTSPPSAASKGPELKMLDIQFLPGRRCVFRYTFIRDTGQPAGTAIPGFSDAPSAVPANREYGREFWEEISWESD